MNEDNSKVISGSEDGSVYIWDSGISRGKCETGSNEKQEKKERNWFGKAKKVDSFAGGVESFEGELQLVLALISEYLLTIVLHSLDWYCDLCSLRSDNKIEEIPLLFE